MRVRAGVRSWIRGTRCGRAGAAGAGSSANVPRRPPAARGASFQGCIRIPPIMGKFARSWWKNSIVNGLCHTRSLILSPSGPIPGRSRLSRFSAEVGPVARTANSWRVQPVSSTSCYLIRLCVRPDPSQSCNAWRSGLACNAPRRFCPRWLPRLCHDVVTSIKETY